MFPKHDQEFLKTPEGNSLYSRWRNIRHRRCKEWGDFSKFAEWALSNGFTKDLQIKRYDNEGEYSPDNCYLYESPNEYILQADWCKKWNETVNRIRAHYGLEPVEMIQEKEEMCVCCGAFIPHGEQACPNCKVTVKNNESENNDG